MFLGSICLVISESCSIYTDTSSRHITLPVMLPSNLTVSKWALSHSIIAAWFITSTNYWCQINQGPYKMKWQNKLYLEDFSESYVLLQLLAKIAANKSWLKILVAWHWMNWASSVWDRDITCKGAMYYSKFSSLRAYLCIFFYSLVKYLAFETNFTLVMTSSENSNFIVLNETAGCKLGKSVLPAELQVTAYKVSGLELKDHGPWYQCTANHKNSICRGFFSLREGGCE